MKFFLFLLMLCSLCVGGCSYNLTRVFYENISEIQRDIFVGKFGEIKATLLLGDRESEYVKNGYSTDRISFAVLMVEGVDLSKEISHTYRLFVDEKVYEGDLENNPFGGLIVDIGNIEIGEVMVLTITSENKSTDIVLRSIVEELEIKSDNAINVVLSEYGGDIGKLKKGRTFNAESYVKLMGTIDIGSDDLCWCITIITRSGKRFSYVVSAYSGKIISVQNNMA